MGWVPVEDCGIVSWIEIPATGRNGGPCCRASWKIQGQDAAEISVIEDLDLLERRGLGVDPPDVEGMA